MLLRLRDDHTTITLSGDGALMRGCTYVPRTPAMSEQQVRSILRSGGEITALARQNVTESTRVVLEGQPSVLLAQVRALEALFPVEAAQRRPASRRVYVEFRVEDSGDVYRSEVLAGRVEWPDTPIGPRLASQAVEIVVIWTRRYYWEHTILQDVPLTNGNGAAVTTGLTVYNHNDGHPGHDNFADISGSAIQGVLPTPAHVALQNTAGSSYFLSYIYLAHNAQSAPLAFQSTLEAEDSVAATGANSASGNTSNGFFRTVTWSGAQSALQAFRWNLSAQQMNHARGNYFRVLARFASPPTATAFVKLQLRYPTTSPLAVLYESDEIALASNAMLQDLGVVPLPPTRLDNPAGLALSLLVRAGQSGQLALDFVQLTPLDSWRHVRQLGFQIASDAVVVDDGPQQQVYGQGPSGQQVSLLTAFGQPVHLWPGRDQRLLALWDEQTGMDISRTFAVRVRYRPRRLTL